ncbi:sugar ABC transporter substrate-binding protein [Christensenella tenuis]|jgi:ABC-type sugar transport system substrate-binding protein|uniref:Sugar ABC transporter substrate-binding protein n=1 Tax=Christensenella tenuis TaxID=2763033 RepID=A0ABR7EK14_9FIRM|nr:sugar ABC transporter substrate-binding protein [Christensenella tenuis]MBC5649474.1 sugar ABC transporter substrate-binding protein [Christensenella tenuis]
MKKIIALVLGTLMVFGLAACSMSSPAESPGTDTDVNAQASAAEEPAAADGEFTVGFCPMDLSNNFWAAIANSFEEAGAEAGITTIVTDGKSDAATQVTALENFISQGVDVIVVGPVDAESLQGVIAEAKSANIPVITHTTAYEDATCNMNVDEIEMGTAIGQLAGQWMVDTFGEDASCKYAILTQSSLEQTIGRENGIQAGIEEFVPNAECVTKVDAHTTDLGMTAAENILSANPDVCAIIGINDSGALGAYETVSARDMGDEFFIGGVDGTDQALQLIKDGTIYRGTVYLNPVGTGQQFIDYALSLKNGEEIPESYMVPVNAISAENIDEYIQ